MAIITFKDKIAKCIWERIGTKGKIPQDLEQRVYEKLVTLDSVETLRELEKNPGNRFKKLKGDLKDFYSIRVNDQYRIIFTWSEGNAYEVKLSKHYE